MTVYESDSGLSLPLSPFGNGKLLIWQAGVSIWSLHCSYTAPSFLSLFPDTAGGYYESESECLHEQAIMRHRLRYTAAGLDTSAQTGREELVIEDRLANGEGIFLRSIEGEVPFRFQLALPGYVRSAVVEDYRLLGCDADALFATLPAGTPFESGLTLRTEQQLAVYLVGGLHYEEDGRAICFDGGRGYMLFVESGLPLESLKTADALIGQLKCGIAPDQLPLFQERACPIAGALKDSLVRLTKRQATRVCDAVSALGSMQASNGMILTDVWHPYAKAIDLPMLTAALLSVGMTEQAAKMIDCWASAMGVNGDGIPPILYADGQAERFTRSCDSHATAAFLLAAVLVAEAAGGKWEDDRTDALYRKMRKAFTLVMHHLVGGMLPFSVSDACFEAGILDRDALMQGSAVATAVAITAAERYIAYCEHSGRKIARESERYLEQLTAAREAFEHHFGGEPLYSLNAPELEEKVRSDRFLRGICPNCSKEGAFEAIEPLKLDRTGRYRCRRCLSKRSADRSNVQLRVSSVDASAVIAFWMSLPFSEKAIEQTSQFYRNSIGQSDTLPKRSGASDAMLLAARSRWQAVDPTGRTSGQSDRTVEPADQAIFRRVFIETAAVDEDPRIELSALPCAFAEGNRMTGAMANSASVAAFVLAMLSQPMHDRAEDAP